MDTINTQPTFDQKPPNRLDYDFSDQKTWNKFAEIQAKYFKDKEKYEKDLKIYEDYQDKLKTIRKKIQEQLQDKTAEDIKNQLEDLLCNIEEKKLKKIYEKQDKKQDKKEKGKKAKGKKAKKNKKEYTKTREGCLEDYDPELCGVRKLTNQSGEDIQCGREIKDNGFVCNACDKMYHNKMKFWQNGHCEVWGQGCCGDLSLGGKLHKNAFTTGRFSYITKGEFEDKREEEFKKKYPLEYSEESSESESEEEESEEELSEPEQE